LTMKLNLKEPKFCPHLRGAQCKHFNLYRKIGSRQRGSTNYCAANYCAAALRGVAAVLRLRKAGTASQSD
jgi:hypothetical protein